MELAQRALRGLTPNQPRMGKHGNTAQRFSLLSLALSENNSPDGFYHKF